MSRGGADYSPMYLMHAWCSCNTGDSGRHCTVGPWNLWRVYNSQDAAVRQGASEIASGRWSGYGKWRVWAVAASREGELVYELKAQG